MLKLARESAHLSDCPPDDCTEQAIPGIRFVFNPMTSDSFLTHYEMETVKYKEDCLARSLSFFDSVNSAKNRLKKLQKNSPLITRRIGTHLAGGELEGADGVVSQVDRKGHFSLYEYANRNLVSKFAIIEQL